MILVFFRRFGASRSLSHELGRLVKLSTPAQLCACANTSVVVGQRMRRQMPRFKWVRTILLNPKTALISVSKHLASRKFVRAHILG